MPHALALAVLSSALLGACASFSSDGGFADIQAATQSQLDLQAVKLQTEALANNLGLTRSTRFINVLELGVMNNGSNVEPQQRA